VGNDQVEQDWSGVEDAPRSLPPQDPTSLRGHRQQTERRLIVGGFGLMFLVGGALIWHFYGVGAMLMAWFFLIWHFYGVGAMLMAWFFLAGGVALFGGLYLILRLMERWTRDEE